MYEAFYGFKEKPFSMLPDPSFLFLSKKHQAALTLLEYGLLNHVGFCVITGEPGAGKTTIVRALLDRISDQITVGLITNTHQSFGGLLDWVLSAFDLHRPNLTSVEMHQIFMEFLIEEYANNRTVLLIVDEAQNMQPDTLEELRMLSNVNSEKDQLLQVVLSGQPALKEMLLRPELMQFAQRIAVDYHLAALSVEETCGYIQHRLVTAGAEKDVFTPAACERIYNYSGGTPRLINLLCETVLVYGFADQLEMIDVDLVDEMVQERMKDSVVPIVNRDIAKQDNKEASEKIEKNFPWIVPKGKPQVLKSKSEITTDEKPEVTQDEAVPAVNVAKKPSSNEDLDSEKEVLIQEKKTESIIKTPVIKPSQILKENGSSSISASAQASSITGDVIPPAEKESKAETRKQFIKYGVISIIFSLVLIIVAVMSNGTDETTSEAIDNGVAELREQQDREKERLKQLQIEAEALKKERDASLAIMEEEKRAKEAAEKLAAEQAAAAAAKKEAEKAAAEKAALAAKAEKKRIREERKRIAAAKEKEREAKYAAERERRKAAKIEEEKRLKEQEEKRRLELEWLEKERQALKVLETSQVIETGVEGLAVKEPTVIEEAIVGNVVEEAVVNEAAVVQEINNAECIGPTARFKANCR